MDGPRRARPAPGRLTVALLLLLGASAGLLGLARPASADASRPVVAAFTGTKGAQSYALSVTVTGGTPPYSYKWYVDWGSGKGCVETQPTANGYCTLFYGTQYASVTVRADQMRHTGGGEFIWLTVEDSQHVYATWLAADGRPSTEFTYGFGSLDPSLNGPTPKLPYRSAPYTTPAGGGPSLPGVQLPGGLPAGQDLASLTALLSAFLPPALVAVALAALLAILKSKLGGSDGEKKKDEDEGGRWTLELTYPAGRSPKVFTTGWVFGARCVINQGTNKEQDVSDQVAWSGSGDFEPSTGARSRPSFASEGGNVITLTYVGQGKTLTRTFAVDAIAPNGFMHLGSLSAVPADAHGCPGCPHPAVGPLVTGSPNVLVNGLPAGRVGDTGTHSACCGPNTWTVATGHPEVLIDGRPAAYKGSRAAHCGGNGTFVEQGG